MGVQRNSLEFVRVQRSSYYESYAYSVVHESSCHEHSDQDNVNLIECIGIWWWSPFPLAALWVMSILEFMKVHDMNIWPIQWHRMRKRFCITFSPGSIPLFCRRPACFTLTHCCWWSVPCFPTCTASTTARTGEPTAVAAAACHPPTDRGSSSVQDTHHRPPNSKSRDAATRAHWTIGTLEWRGPPRCCCAVRKAAR